MRRYLVAKIGDAKTEVLREKHPDLISVSGARNGKPYGTVRSQVDKLKRAKLLDTDAAIMSCSWGMGQVMGKTYKWLYEIPSDLEKAQNQCLKQQYLYMLKYFENVSGMVKAMKDKNWIKMAVLYNGGGWAKTNPHYPTNVKKYYESFKKNGL